MFGVNQSKQSSSVVGLLTCLALCLSACAEVPEGRFSCTSAAECPSDWVCRLGEASATQTRCYSTSLDAGVVDVGVDAGVDGAAPDVLEAGTDGAAPDVFDAGTPDVFDGGTPDVFDGGPADGFVADARPDGCVEGAPGPAPEPCPPGEALRLHFVRVSEGTLPTDGIAGMDDLCVRSAGPGYKALVMSSTRHAGEPAGFGPLDWVLEPNTCYALGGRLAFRTNTRAVSYGVPATPITDGRVNFWTGISSDWRPTGIDCNEWTSNSDDARGSVGVEATQCTTDPFIGRHGVVDCDGGWGVLCVEQRP